MPKNSGFTFSPSDYVISTAALGTALPSALPTSSLVLNLPTGWYDIGFASDAGVTEGHNVNETQVFDMVGRLVRTLRNQETRPWTFECDQVDAISSGLTYPGATVSSSGGTAEVQTITITGTPTAGTFSVAFAGYPTVTGLAYNIATTALATALSQAWDITVTVTGTAGTSYVVTFPANEGNVPQMNVASAFTPTSATASNATTTPGVSGMNTRLIGAGTGQNLRQFCIDLFDGVKIERNLLTYAEAVWSGTKTYSGSALTITQFTVTPYLDPATNGYYTKLDNFPSIAENYA